MSNISKHRNTTRSKEQPSHHSGPIKADTVLHQVLTRVAEEVAASLQRTQNAGGDDQSRKNRINKSTQ